MLVLGFMEDNGVDRQPWSCGRTWNASDEAIVNAATNTEKDFIMVINFIKSAFDANNVPSYAMKWDSMQSTTTCRTCRHCCEQIAPQITIEIKVHILLMSHMSSCVHVTGVMKSVFKGNVIISSSCWSCSSKYRKKHDRKIFVQYRYDHSCFML